MSEADSEVIGAGAGRQAPERATSAGLVLALVGLAWAAAMLFSARATITGNEQAELEVVSTAYAMPGAVSASLIGGATIALAVLAAISRRRELGATVRFAVSAATGLAAGLAGALAIISINTEGWIYAVVGGTVAAAATIGGALAGFRYPRVLAAVCWASIVVFLVGVVLAFLQDDLLPVFGAGDTSRSQADAAGYWGYAQGLLSGLASGLLTYWLLRRARARSGTDVRWPFYALAGGGPGLLLIVAELLTRTAGARVLDLAGRVSPLDTAVQQLLSDTRLNNGLMVLFVGAFTAMLVVGRTLKAPADEAPAPESASAGRANARSRAVAGSGRPAGPEAETATVEPAGDRPTDPDEIERAARAEDDEPAQPATDAGEAARKGRAEGTAGREARVEDTEPARVAPRKEA